MDGPEVAVVPGSERALLPHNAQGALTRRAMAMMRMMVRGTESRHSPLRLARGFRGVKGTNRRGLGARGLCE